MLSFAGVLLAILMAFGTAHAAQQYSGADAGVPAAGSTSGAQTQAGFYLDFAIACSGHASMRGSPQDSSVCIDKRFVFKNLHVTNIEIHYLKKFDSYVVSLQFDHNQITKLNSFIKANLNKRYFIVKNNVVIDAYPYFVFSGKLTLPEIDIGVGSKREGIDLRNDLRTSKANQP